MREIKFRGKEIETGKWVYGKLIENKNKGKGIFSGYHYIIPFDITPYAGNNEHTITSGGYPEYSQEDYSHCLKNRKAITIAVIEVDNDTIGQYTGLKDKNGKEIYEGDIVKITHRGETDIGKIIYEYNGFTVDVMNMNKPYGRIKLEMLERFIEVIGNIYDNKELLKE